MARIRTIKPEFWTDSKILRLTIPARLFFIGLWNFADDNGVIPDDTLQLKAQIFPCDNIDVGKLIDELESVGLIKRFDNGKRYIWIINFLKHQRIDRPRKSNYPLPQQHTCVFELCQTQDNFSQTSLSDDFTRFHVKSHEITLGTERKGNIKETTNVREESPPSSSPSCEESYHDLLLKIPEHLRELAIAKIKRFNDKGDGYIRRNLIHALKHARGNLLAYLGKALENDYGASELPELKQQELQEEERQKEEEERRKFKIAQDRFNRLSDDEKQRLFDIVLEKFPITKSYYKTSMHGLVEIVAIHELAKEMEQCESSAISQGKQFLSLGHA